jgi:hypothetical protein
MWCGYGMDTLPIDTIKFSTMPAGSNSRRELKEWSLSVGRLPIHIMHTVPACSRSAPLVTGKMFATSTCSMHKRIRDCSVRASLYMCARTWCSHVRLNSKLVQVLLARVFTSRSLLDPVKLADRKIPGQASYTSCTTTIQTPKQI